MSIGHLYIRVSTDEQADKGFSQKDQEDRLRIHCSRNNIQIGKVIMDDHSAKTFDRPEWKKLLADLKRAKARIVITSCLPNRIGLAGIPLMPMV